MNICEKNNEIYEIVRKYMKINEHLRRSIKKGNGDLRNSTKLYENLWKINENLRKCVKKTTKPTKIYEIV